MLASPPCYTDAGLLVAAYLTFLFLAAMNQLGSITFISLCSRLTGSFVVP